MESAMATMPGHSEDWRRRTAGFVVQSILSGRRLPEHLAGLDDREMVSRLARMDAKELLDTLREVYEIPYWTRESFQRVVVEGALQGWRPGSVARETPTGLRLVSTTCPVAADVERDPRICLACQDLQRHAAYLALIGQVESVDFSQLMSRGEGACEMNVRWREP